MSVDEFPSWVFTAALFIGWFTLAMAVLQYAIYTVQTLLAFFELRRNREQERRVHAGWIIGARSSPGISLLVPAYNEERTIVDNIRSLLTLRYPRYEMIVVNDGSKDGTARAVIEAFKLERVPLRRPHPAPGRLGPVALRRDPLPDLGRQPPHAALQPGHPPVGVAEAQLPHPVDGLVDGEHQPAPFEGHAFRHHQNQLVALDRGHHRQTDPRVTRSRFYDRTAGLEIAGFLSRFHHRQRDPVLDRATWICSFGFDPDLVIRKQPGQTDMRGVSDRRENALNLHFQAPSSSSDRRHIVGRRS